MSTARKAELALHDTASAVPAVRASSLALLFDGLLLICP